MSSTWCSLAQLLEVVYPQYVHNVSLLGSTGLMLVYTWPLVVGSAADCRCARRWRAHVLSEAVVDAGIAPSACLNLSVASAMIEDNNAIWWSGRPGR